MSYFSHTIERENGPVEVECEIVYERYIRPSRDDPGQEPCLYVEEAWLAGTKTPAELTDDEENQILSAWKAKHSDDDAPDYPL